MRSDWYVVICTIENAGRTERYETIINAFSSSHAESEAKKYWETKNNITISIESCQPLDPSDVITLRCFR